MGWTCPIPRPCVALFAPDGLNRGQLQGGCVRAVQLGLSAICPADRPVPALAYLPRLARLTEIRAYVRAQFLREGAGINWINVGAKVDKLIDERTDADMRELMKPVSILDQDFHQKIAALPHD